MMRSPSGMHSMHRTPHLSAMRRLEAGKHMPRFPGRSTGHKEG